MFLGLIGISLAFDGPIDQVYAQRGKPHDVCGRLLYYSDGTPQYYRNPCPAPNGVDLMAGVSPALNNRFEPAYVAYSVGGSWVEAVSMDDFDQDEKLDMALSTSSYFDPTRDQRVWVAKQNSPTNFSLTYSGTVGASDPRSLDVANMNDDSALDIVVANAGGGTSGVSVKFCNELDRACC
jgi:hypothetical protein